MSAARQVVRVHDEALARDGEECLQVPVRRVRVQDPQRVMGSGM